MAGPYTKNSGRYSLGITDTGEAGPADIRAIGKVVQQVLGLAQLLQHRRPSDAGSQGGGSDGGRHDVAGSESKKEGRAEIFLLIRGGPGGTASRRRFIKGKLCRPENVKGNDKPVNPNNSKEGVYRRKEKGKLAQTKIKREQRREVKSRKRALPD